ncbi:hypothetical protein [Stenotrophomonas bentonitica]|uniref:hypothetical protein n=1 Tax=Stenotrophomonas bentonitica TaxID=1450134 RepID=UPI00345E3EC2
MDASLSLNRGEEAQLRWLPRLNFIASALALLWMIPSWWMLHGMFADLPLEARPPSVALDLLVALPGIAGLCLAIAGSCLARQRGYAACLVASALTLFAGPLLVVGIINIVFMMRPAVKALFQERAP